MPLPQLILSAPSGVTCHHYRLRLSVHSSHRYPNRCCHTFWSRVGTFGPLATTIPTAVGTVVKPPTAVVGTCWARNPRCGCRYTMASYRNYRCCSCWRDSGQGLKRSEYAPRALNADTSALPLTRLSTARHFVDPRQEKKKKKERTVHTRKYARTSPRALSLVEPAGKTA